MTKALTSVDLLPDGLLLLLLDDGPQALVNHGDVIECAEKTEASEKAEKHRWKRTKTNWKREP
jgi:hypothetical protein